MMTLFVPLAMQAQTAHRSLLQGDELYDKAKYSEAKKPYYEALKKSKSNGKANYNLGNTYYREGDYSNAAKMLENAAQSAKTPPERADAYHNLGNAFLKQEKFKEAISAYQNSLMNRPGDPETKQNLQMAKKKLEQQEQQQQQQSQQQQQNQNNQNQQQQNPKDQNPQPQNSEQKQPEKPQPQESQEQQIPKPEQPSEQFLEAIGREDRRNKRKYQEKTNNSKPSTRRKDW